MRLKKKFRQVYLFGLALVLVGFCSAGSFVQEQSRASKKQPISKDEDQIFSLCERDEEVYFSCLTESKKTVSLCVSRPEGRGASLVYRFGGRGNIDFEYSAVLDSSLPSSPSSGQAFHKNRYSRALVDYTEVAFKSGGQEYRVFRRFSGESIGQQRLLTPSLEFGVEVSEAGSGEEMGAITCNTVHLDNLRNLSRLLACDDSNALGCAD